MISDADLKKIKDAVLAADRVDGRRWVGMMEGVGPSAETYYQTLAPSQEHAKMCSLLSPQRVAEMIHEIEYLREERDFLRAALAGEMFKVKYSDTWKPEPESEKKT